MATTPEGKVKTQVKKLLASYGDRIYSEWPVPSGFGKSGLDATCCADGRFFTIETKAPGKRLTPRQELTVMEVRRAGGVVFIIGEELRSDGHYSGMIELKLWLEKLLKR
jgi:hypothetical protein